VGANPAIDLSETSNSNGEYSYEKWSVFGIQFGLPAGNYTVVLSKKDYITTSFNVVVVAGENTEFNGSISPVTNESDYRIVLSWGEEPYDLDSHYVAKITDGDIEHIYFSVMAGESANLDIDDTSSYGPETVYISGIECLDGGFYYSVHNYSNRDDSMSYELSNSGATVQLYRGAALIATYYVPSGQEGTVWNVFHISQGGKVIPVNSITYESDPGNVGLDLISSESSPE